MSKEQSDNNNRIAKNTLYLYMRMLFSMIVSLFTSRVILNTLGVEDYGINNVVGGIITMFGFLNGAMTTATQRYLTFELGKKNYAQLNKVFNTSISIHLLISLVVLILGETVGLWFLYNKMIIPQNRMDAAFWVYQFSILSFIVMIVSIPYNAVIVAHEKMSAFAYISLFEVFLKLGIVCMLYFSAYDKLIVFSFLMFLSQLLMRIIYGAYCEKYFNETKFKLYFDCNLFREMFSFAGWNLWGNCAAIAFTQGLNILLNMFFGPVVNAARGIAVQVQTAIQQFSNNFQMALNPQITKTYAKQDYSYMHSLMFRSSKFTFLLLFFLSLPIMIETEMILTLWLKIVPHYAVTFVRITLCVTIIDSMSNAFMVGAAATGKVKRYQSIVGGILLSILPISYVVLKMGAAPWSVFVVHLCVCIVAFFVRLFIIRPMLQLSVKSYMREVILRVVSVVVLSVPIPLFVFYALPTCVLSLIGVCSLCASIVLIMSYFVGLNQNERKYIVEKIIVLKNKLGNKAF